jgi:DNA-binding CsgD family transcriptional regulator
MANLQEQDIESTIESLYLAVSDENRWPEALAGLARAFDTPRIGILRAAPRMDCLYELRALNFEPETQRLYNDHYWALDPAHRATRDAPVGRWLDCPPLFDPRSTPEPEYVNEFAIPRGIRWVAGGKVYADAKSCTILGLQRPADHKPFGEAAERVFKRLWGHIGRASKLSADLRDAELAKGLSLAALNSIQWPVYAVNSSARLLLANLVGERQLMLANPFGIRAGHLVCADPNDAAALQDAIRQVGRNRVSAFRNSHAEGQWHVRVLPVAGYAGVALIYAAPANPVPVATDILRQTLHFSEAEAEIAFMLADGSTVKEIAFARAVSVNTVRTQVREIFRKAGVRRQTDLAKLLFGISQVYYGAR